MPKVTLAQYKTVEIPPNDLWDVYYCGKLRSHPIHTAIACTRADCSTIGLYEGWLTINPNVSWMFVRRTQAEVTK